MKDCIARMIRRHRSLNPTVFRLAGCLLLYAAIGSAAQAATTITPTTGAGNLGTQVLPPSGHVYGITGGNPVGNNLYHSFAQFNVGTGDIAQFQTPTPTPNAAMHNILGRITDANPSTIFGTIDSATYYPNANLFLMNPYGFLFGPNAMVNVGGMVTFTTADYLRLTDNIRFEAIPGAQDALLSTASVAAFGFLGSNPAAITVAGSQLILANGTGLSLVGGNVSIGADPATGTPALISAPSGKIDLVSVASPGEILYPSLQTGPNIHGQTFTEKGTVSISDFSFLDVSGITGEGNEAGGAVRIRGGQFVMDNLSVIQNMTMGDIAGENPGISVVVDHDIRLTNLSSISVGTGAGLGRSGNLDVSAENIEILSGSFLTSFSGGPAAPGDLTITATQSLTLSGLDPFVGTEPSNISTTAQSSVVGGNITIDSAGSTLSIQDNATIGTASNTGHAGNITLNSNILNITNGGAIRTASAFGSSGTIMITANDSAVISGQSALGNVSTIASDSQTSPASISITAGHFVLADQAEINGDTASQQGGTVNITATQSINISGNSAIRSSTTAGTGTSLELSAPTIAIDQSTLSTRISGSNPNNVGGTIKATATNGNISVSNNSLIAASTAGAADGGSIELRASDSIIVTANSRIESMSTGTGNAGNITIQASDVQLKTGAILTAETSGSGAGGKVTISADQRITVTDSYILTSAVPESGEGGAGGDIVLNAPTLSLEGSGLFASTSSTGKAGDVALQGEQITLASNTLVATSTDGQGAAGTIRVEGLQGPGSRATSVTLSNSRIESETTGNVGSEGPAGNIFVETARLTLTDSQFSTRSSFSPGDAGQLVVNASDQIQLVRSNITSSSEGAVTDVVTGDPLQTGNAGQIIMQAPHILIENASKVTTNTEFTGQAGNITLNTANLEVRSGAQITSSSSAQESSPTGNAGTVTVQDLASPAQSILIDGAGSGIFTDTQGTGAGGNIFVNANSVTLQNGGTLSAATSGAEATETGGTITVEGNIVQLNSGGTITAQSTGTGNAGDVTIQGHAGPANSIVISGFDENFNSSGIFTDTQATGAGGNIHISAKSISLQDGGTLSATTSGTAPTATGGTITVDAETLSMDGAIITAGTLADNTGRAGDVTISAKTIDTTNSSFISTFSMGIGQAGDISLKATDGITLIDSFVNSDAASFSSTTAGNGGLIHFNAPMIDLQSTLLGTISLGAGNAGNVLLEAQQLNIQSSVFGRAINTGTELAAQTQGSGNAGTIIIRGLEGEGSSADIVTITDASRLSSRTSGTGAGGIINLFTESFIMQNGSTLSAKTTGAGDAGSITIQGIASPAQSVLIDGPLSGIFTDTQGTGAGGNIFVNANSVTLQNGAGLSSKTTGTGNAGEITITGNTLSLASGSQISSASTGTTAITKPDGTTEAPGTAGSINITDAGGFLSNASTVATSAEANHGGDISITAQSVQLSGGTSITASSKAPLQVTEVVLIDGQLVSQVVGNGNAGNILINAGQNYTSTNSAVTTKAATASGGNIMVLASDMVHLTNSQLNASVQGSSTTVGGNITIDPQYVILQNSQILAQATQGQGGAISITIANGGLFLADANSTVSASSQFGVNGTVTIQSPNAPISGQIQPLGKTPLIATSLLNQHCASLAGGEFSSFTVAGRDSLPTEPGSWLSSPLATLNAGMGLGGKAEGESAGAGQVGSGQWRVGDTPLLSLRQIAPAGFLTQAFAVEGASSCQS